MSITRERAHAMLTSGHKIRTIRGGFIGTIVAVDINLDGTALETPAEYTGCTIRIVNTDPLDPARWEEHHTLLSEIEPYHGDAETRDFTVKGGKSRVSVTYRY